jgi:hypothetical protein
MRIREEIQALPRPAGVAGQPVSALGLSTLAETLRQNDLKHLLSRAEDFARKQPVLFAGAAVALGFTLSRAARAGTQDTQERGALKQETSGPSYTDVEEVEIEH